MESSVKKNPVHYLAHLEYKNKVKKQQDIEYLRKHGHLIKREENFHLFFNGANDDRIKNSKKASNLEGSKSPANRKKWNSNNQKTMYRRQWENPVTPLLLKEQVEPNNYFPEIANRHSREEFKKEDIMNTKTTFQLAGNCLVRPDSRKDHNKIAQRIEKLTSDKRDKILQMLDQLEIDHLNGYEV